MSIRARRIIKKELAEPSFNVWHDTDLVNCFKKTGGYTEMLGLDGNGAIEVTATAIEYVLEHFKFEENDYRRDALKADLLQAKATGDDYVIYECY